MLEQLKELLLPLDGGYFRNHESLSRTSGKLADLWNDQSWRSARTAEVREAEAIIATARWATESALLRRESRGLQRRTDFPDVNPGLAQPIESGGTTRPWAVFQSAQEMSAAS